MVSLLRALFYFINKKSSNKCIGQINAIFEMYRKVSKCSKKVAKKVDLLCSFSSHSASRRTILVGLVSLYAGFSICQMLTVIYYLGMSVQVGNGIELETVGSRFEPYRWRRILFPNSRGNKAAANLRLKALSVIGIFYSCLGESPPYGGSICNWNILLMSREK